MTSAAYWEDVEPLVAQAVRERIDEFQEAGIRGRRSLSRLLRSGAGRVLAPLAAEARHAAARAGDAQAARPERAVRGGMRPVRSHARGRARRGAARGEALAAGAAHAHVKRARRPRSAHRVVRAGLGRVRGAGLPLRRSLAPRRASSASISTATWSGGWPRRRAATSMLWDSATRAAKGALGAARRPHGDDRRAPPRRARWPRSRTLEAARELLEQRRRRRRADVLRPRWRLCWKCCRWSRRSRGKLELPDAAQGAGARLRCTGEACAGSRSPSSVREPEQLKMWQDETPATT